MSSGSEHESDESEQMNATNIVSSNPLVIAAIVCAYACIFIFGFAGNLLIVFTVLCSRQARTITNIFMYVCLMLFVSPSLMSTLQGPLIASCSLFYSYAVVTLP